jgi:hypothetical protein
MKADDIFATDLSQELIQFGKNYLADVLKIGLLLGLSSTIHGTSLLSSQMMKSILAVGQKLLGRHNEIGNLISEKIQHLASRFVRVLQWVANHPLVEKMVEKATTWLKNGVKTLCAKFFGPSLVNAYLQSSSQECDASNDVANDKNDGKSEGRGAEPQKSSTTEIEEVVEITMPAPAIEETRLQQQLIAPANLSVTDWYFNRAEVQQQPSLPNKSPADLEDAQEIVINPFAGLASLIDSAVGTTAKMISDVVVGPQQPAQPLSAVQTLMNSRAAAPANTSVVSRI